MEEFDKQKVSLQISDDLQTDDIKELHNTIDRLANEVENLQKIIQDLQKNSKSSTEHTYDGIVSEKVNESNQFSIPPVNRYDMHQDRMIDSKYQHMSFEPNSFTSNAPITKALLALSKKMARIALVNLTNDTYQMIHDVSYSISGKKSELIPSIKEELVFWAKTYVYPDDKELYLKRVSSEYILHWFEGDHEEYHHYYRRKFDEVYRWVHLYIFKTDNYREDNKEFYFFVEDTHDLFLRMLDVDNMTSFSKHYKTEKAEDIYYDNIFKIMDGLTSEYLDFYMIDLEKDLYIKYKAQSRVAAEYIEPVAGYTQTSVNYIRDHFSGEQAKFLLKFSSSEKLRKLLTDRLSIEYSFIAPGGATVTTIVQKLESINGIPTKVLCRSVLKSTSRKLKVKTFGNFEVFKENGEQVIFGRKQSKQLFAYLIDKQGFPVSSKDIVTDILEKSLDDSNAIKYVSTLIKRTMDDLKKAGYPTVIIKEQRTIRIDPNIIDCDYYHIKNGNFTALYDYHNEYMKEYSWAESTNAEIAMLINGI